MNNKSQTKTIVTLGLLTAIMLLMSLTPLGYLHIGPIEITFNVIPLAIAAITLGIKGGVIIGAIFGITSFLQCIGIGGTSMFGAALFEISPIYTIILTIVPRILDGYLTGLIFNALKNHINNTLSSAIAGFSAAFLNTLFFVSLLIILFKDSEYLQGLIGGRNLIVFACAFVGLNAIFEILASTIITSAIGQALIKTKVINTYER